VSQASVNRWVAEHLATVDLTAVPPGSTRSAGAADASSPTPFAQTVAEPTSAQRISIRHIRTPQIAAIPGSHCSSAIHETPDGQLLLATGGSDDVVRIWSLDDAAAENRLLNSVDTFADRIRSLSWQALPAGRLLLAVILDNGWTWLCEIDPSDGTVQETEFRAPYFAPATVIDCCLRPDGRLLVATGSQTTSRVVIRELDLRSLSWSEPTGFHLDGPPSSLAWHLSSESDPLLACGGAGFGIVLCKIDISSGHVSQHPVHADMAEVSQVAWFASPGGRLLLAGLNRRPPDPGSGLHEPYRSNDIGVFEVGVPEVRATLVHRLGDGSVSPASSFSWCGLPDGGTVLIVARARRPLQVWSLEDEFGLLEKQPPLTAWAQHMSCCLTRTGRLLCVISGTPLHEGQIVELCVRSPSVETSTMASHGPGVRRCSVTGMLQLGAAGMWLGIGLIDDIVSITGGAIDSALHNPLLAAALGTAGVGRLRGLRWPPAARVGFVGLSCAELPAVDEWVPPDGTSRMELLRELMSSSTVAAGSASVKVDVRAVVSALAGIDDDVIRLLEILGPRRVAADPTTPLRLLDRARQLPALPARLRLMLTAGDRRVQTNVQASGVERTQNSRPMAVRHGRPDSLVPAHLALALSVGALEQAVLEAGQELLYRRYTIPSRPPLRPVVLVLDTSPPTFGPIEMVLRTVAHLAVVMSWQARVNPMLVTLTRPAHAREVGSTDGLMEVWTSRTLASPEPAAAMATAAGTGLPVVVLTTRHVALAHLSTKPSDDTSARFVTTHGPHDRSPAAESIGRRHFHLPLDPGPERVTHVLTELLTP
jgi:WD40 repeat protein